jgi:PKD repeat protein
VTNGNGANSNATTQTVHVTSTRPTASFTVGATRVVGRDVTFTSTVTGSDVRYAWDFGDGTGSDVANPTHPYSTARNYTVTLTVSNDGGPASAAPQTFRVYAQPTATITPPSGTITAGVQFTIAATITGGTAEWTFDEGSGPTAGASVRHTFTTAGDHTVTVTVTNDGGGTITSAPVTINVLPPMPQPTFTITAGTDPGAFVFTNTTSVGGPFTDANIQWDFDNNGTFDASGPTANHTYSGDGPFDVVLRVTNAAGNASSTRRIPVRPTVNFNYTGGPTSATAFDFDNATTGGPYANAAVTWDFGDAGATATGNAAQHRFSGPGTYNVVITVVHPMWGTLTHSRTIILLA